MEGDIEIMICERFDSPDGDDIEDWDEVEDWKTEDYWAYNIPKEKFYIIVNERTKYCIELGERIGLRRDYLNSVLTYYSINDKSYEMYDTNGIYEYYSFRTKFGRKLANYSHKYYKNGQTESITWYNHAKFFDQKPIKYSLCYHTNGVPKKKIYYSEGGEMTKYIKYKDGVGHELEKNPKADRNINMDYDEQLFHFGDKRNNYPFMDDDYLMENNYFPNTESSTSDGMSDDDSSSWGSSCSGSPEQPPFSFTNPFNES